MALTPATILPTDRLGASPSGTPTHPLYATWAPVWRKLLHCYEGSGGFLDGTYLVAHPREWEDYTAAIPQKPTKKLLARRKLARYENICATILDQKRMALFRGEIVRTVGDPKKDTPHPLELWWSNVDGNRTHIADYMTAAFTPAALFGHVLHVMDRPRGPQPVTKAEEQAPYLRLYSPLDMPDWLTDEAGRLTAVKLLEAVQRTSLDQAASTTDYRERILTAETWATGTRGVRDQGPHTFGRLPVVLHYGKRRALGAVIGQSVLFDPQLYIDLYNLTSEIRELLRAQTFGILNIELGTGDQATGAEVAKAMLGQTTGTENVAFTPGPMQYVQPDTANVSIYQEERRELLRTIYRITALAWEADSRDTEATGSLKLKREDMNQVLASYADECEKAEYEIAELWFRAEYGERWEEELTKAEVVIRYPDSFDVTPFAEILEQAQAAITLNMGSEFMTELRRRLVAKFLPDAPAGVIATIDQQLVKIGTQEQAAGAQQPADKIKALLQQYGASNLDQSAV